MDLSQMKSGLKFTAPLFKISVRKNRAHKRKLFNAETVRRRHVKERSLLDYMLPYSHIIRYKCDS